MHLPGRVCSFPCPSPSLNAHMRITLNPAACMSRSVLRTMSRSLSIAFDCCNTRHMQPKCSTRVSAGVRGCGTDTQAQAARSDASWCFVPQSVTEVTHSSGCSAVHVRHHIRAFYMLGTCTTTRALEATASCSGAAVQLHCCNARQLPAASLTSR
jgi:hypothetical protein